MVEITVKLKEDIYRHLKELSVISGRDVKNIVEDIIQGNIRSRREKEASRLFSDGKITFTEACELAAATPSEMTGILLKHGVKFGSERLMPSDIGLKNLRERFR